MKRLISIVICILLTISCTYFSGAEKEVVVSMSPSETTEPEKTTDKTNTLPALYLGEEKSEIMDVTIEKDYVLLPLYKILLLLGAKLTKDSRFDNYHTFCLELQSKKFIIDWDHNLLISLEDMNDQVITDGKNITCEIADENNLLSGYSEEWGSECVFWNTREICIGNDALTQLMKKMGISITVTWNYEDQIVVIDQ